MYNDIMLVKNAQIVLVVVSQAHRIGLIWKMQFFKRVRF